ncbi:unnamed protein product, partial [Medioppia subpectinata]
MECAIHESKWHLWTRVGHQLCVQCSQHKWSSPLENHFTRRKLVEELENALRNGSVWVTTHLTSHHFGVDERLAFVVSIAQLVFDADTNVQKCANNCLKLILSQLNDNSIVDLVTDYIIEELTSDDKPLSEWSLDLVSHCLPFCTTDGIRDHRITDRMSNVLEALREEYPKHDSRLKRVVLKLFITIYDTLGANQLFRLDQRFHAKTFHMVLIAFEPQSIGSDDNDILYNSTQLLKKVSTIESVLQLLVTNQNLLKYLHILLANECEELRVYVLVWICDLLENESIQKRFANILLNDKMDSFIEMLLSSDNPFISNHLLNCVNLILTNIGRPVGATRVSPLSNAVIKALEISVVCKDSNLFINGLAALRQLMQRNPSVELFSEFEFFALIDMLEIFISNFDLFLYVVKFLSDFLNISVIPTLIPTEKMKAILTKVLQNVSFDSTGAEEEDIDESIRRTTCAVELIKSYLNLVNDIKNRELNLKESKDNSIYLLNGEMKPQLNEMDLCDENESQTFDLAKACKETEIYEFLSFCLTTIENIFELSLERLIKDENSQQNAILFETLMSCLIIILDTDLHTTESINALVKRTFSNGHVLTLIQIVSICEFPFNTPQFKQQSVILLSYFLFKILENDHKNEIYFQTDQTFDRSYFESGFNQINNNLIFRLTRNALPYDSNDSVHQFYRTFFAAHYYSLRCDVTKYQRNEEYNKFFITILNQYMKRDLSYDQNSALTVKYSLLLAAMTHLDAQSIAALRQFFNDRNHNFYAMYYTNHIVVLNWLFNVLKSDHFCEYALREFFETIPENYSQHEKKEIISSFFQLIHTNDKALQILIQIICDTITNASVLEIIYKILNDFDQFLDESDICNNWNLFCNKILDNLPAIIIRIVDRIKNLFNDDINPEEEEKAMKMLDLLCRMLSKHSEMCDFKSKHLQLEALMTKLLEFIENNLSSNEEKCDEMRQLLLHLLNAYFRTHITLTQMTDLLTRIFDGLSSFGSELRKHLARNPWFELIITKYINEKKILDKELFAFLLMFFKMDVINRALTDVTNELTVKYIQFINEPKGNGFCDEIFHQFSGRHLLSKSFWIINPLDFSIDFIGGIVEMKVEICYLNRRLIRQNRVYYEFTRQQFKDSNAKEVEEWKRLKQMKDKERISRLQKQEMETINKQLIDLREEYRRICGERGRAHKWATIVSKQETERQEFEKRRNKDVMKRSTQSLNQFITQNNVKQNDLKIEKENQILKRKQLMKSSLYKQNVAEEDVHILRQLQSLQKSEDLLREVIEKKREVSHSEESIERNAERLFWPKKLVPKQDFLRTQSVSSSNLTENSVQNNDTKDSSVNRDEEVRDELQMSVNTEEYLPTSIAIKLYERLKNRRKNVEQKSEKIYRNAAISTDSPIKSALINVDSNDSETEQNSSETSCQTSYLSVPMPSNRAAIA